MITLSLNEARSLAVVSQGLDGAWSLPRGKEGAARVVERLGYVQIDTISVVERAHHHTLWNRRPDYRPAMLEALLAEDRRVFEYWVTPAAGYAPMSDFRWYLPRMIRERGSSTINGWFTAHAKDVRHVLDRIKAEGPLGSSDFEAPPGAKRAGWWDWKPAKRALELLYTRGELMVSSRRGFQRRYDLAERVLPSRIDTTVPSDDEHQRFCALRHLRAHGISHASHIRWASNRQVSKGAISELVETGEIVPARVDGRQGTWYAVKRLLEARRKPRESHAPHVTFLSPFDSLMNNRYRVAELFDFDYRIECYVPGPLRKHGYFVLPILFGNVLVGRMDAKAFRKERRLVVHRLTLEPRVKASTELIGELRSALRSFATFNGCDDISIDHTQPKSLNRALSR